MSLRKIELGHLYFADMVMYTELHFEKNLMIWISNFEKMSSCQNASKYRSNLKNNIIVKRQGTRPGLRRVTITCILYLMIKWIIINVFSLDFHHFLKHLYLYIPDKFCKHSLKDINFTALVYKRFDNPWYSVHYYQEVILAS